MLFNSLAFAIFFPIVTYLYFKLAHRYRWALLLFASCIFYMWFIPKYILIIGITILIDYWAGMAIEDSEGAKKKRYLILSIISTCLVLFIFKYYHFFYENFLEAAKLFGFHYPEKIIQIILPVGLSFHTFQSLAYVIEVYRGSQKAERHFGIYSLYVMFYPQLVAGPIERPQNLLHQFYEEHSFDQRRVVDGLKRMAGGLFKKVVIADRLSALVNHVYDHPQGQNGLVLAVATVLFAFQIYCDFSGYSDIAIGSAEVMGFKLMNNFNRPYFSKSISEFWKRWHISLSTWFKDYLYISLGGNRCSRPRLYFNLLITFIISGFWHGANWTYVAWGTLNGFYLVFALMIEKSKLNFSLRSHRVVQLLTTFTLICFSWIFFRAKTISDAFYVVRQVLDVTTYQFAQFFENLGTSSVEFGLCLVLVGGLIIVELNQRRIPLREQISYQPTWVRWSLYYAFVLMLFFLRAGGGEGAKQFIYFQF